MKRTGIVRRIDDLGRVVIPKEIRRTMHIKEGDPLEIMVTDDGSVTFTKYRPTDDISSIVNDLRGSVVDCEYLNMDTKIALHEKISEITDMLKAADHSEAEAR